MSMQRITIEQAKRIAQNKGLKPGRVKGTADAVQLTKGRNPKMDIIAWEDFEAVLKRKGLAVYESGGFMRIMRA